MLAEHLLAFLNKGIYLGAVLLAIFTAFGTCPYAKQLTFILFHSTEQLTQNDTQLNRFKGLAQEPAAAS